MAASDDPGLVRPGATRRRDRLGHRGLVSQRPAAAAHSLGRDPRSQGPVHTCPPTPLRFGGHGSVVAPWVAGCARETQALLSTDRTVAPAQIIQWFVLRWQLEVTSPEVREHLGVETQRQWSDLAIGRTTPALLALFSLVTLLAHPRAQRRTLPIRQTAWYQKIQPTFSDALALARWQIWQHACFPSVVSPSDNHKSPAAIQNRLLSALCYSP